LFIGNCTLSENHENIAWIKELISHVPLTVEKLSRQMSGTKYTRINSDVISYDTFVCKNPNVFIDEIEIRAAKVPDSKWTSLTSVIFNKKFNIDKHDITSNFGQNPESIGSDSIDFELKATQPVIEY